ncbi:hypothetical protein BJ878DRAFT_476572 [Calycina marina]|uniref:RING-type domain-containing protein n=1 Tax=Calycina marina TaxID=1763456 RepID=A0A9P7ZAV0_9HELO|nr:hypothetical protein BJ878DRAFT_476572 [Calycina marina]
MEKARIMGSPLLSPNKEFKGKLHGILDKAIKTSRENTPIKPEPDTEPSSLVEHKQKEVNLTSILQNDLTDAKSLVTCSICDQLLYEPWTLACGHTYCYSCLCNWFVPNELKKTCPNCRMAVKQMPAPSFIIKQMVNLLMGRSEILPADETIDQHKERAREETEAVEKDRNDPAGLFKGTFPYRTTHPLLYDEEDDVARCPGCQHEYEGGSVCTHCHHVFDRDDEHYFSDEDNFEMDDDMSDQDELDVLNMDSDLEDEMEHDREIITSRRRIREQRHILAAHSRIHALAHAVVEAHPGHPDILDQVELAPYHQRYLGALSDRVSISDSEDDNSDAEDSDEDTSDGSDNSTDDEENPEQPPRSRRPRAILDSDSDSEDGGEISTGRRDGRRQRPISIISDDTSEENERELRQAGWRGLSPSFDERRAEWSPLESESGNSQSEQTVIGNSPSVGPESRRFYEDGEESDDDDVDEDGDTEMSTAGDYNTDYDAFQRRSESRDLSAEPGTDGYAPTIESGSSTPAPSSIYGGYSMAENLGVVHEIHRADSSDESDDEAILPPRRRPRTHHSPRVSGSRRVRTNASLIQQGLISGSQTEINGRIHFQPAQKNVNESQERTDFNNYMTRRAESYRQRQPERSRQTDPRPPCVSEPPFAPIGAWGPWGPGAF